MPRLRRSLLVGLFTASTLHSVASAQVNLTTYVYKVSTISDGGFGPELFWGMPAGYLTMLRQFDHIQSLQFTVGSTSAFYSLKPDEGLLFPISIITARIDLRSIGYLGAAEPGFGLAWLLCNPPTVLILNVIHSFGSTCPMPPDAVAPASLAFPPLFRSDWLTPDGGQVITLNEQSMFLDSITVAPEPATIVLLAAGLVVIGLVNLVTRRSRIGKPFATS
jgi:hypothetical protein